MPRKAKAKQIELSYYFSGRDLDDVLKLGHKLVVARDDVRFHYGDAIDSDVRLDNFGKLVYWTVSIKEKRPGKIKSIKPAIKEYLSLTGLTGYLSPSELLSIFGFDNVEVRSNYGFDDIEKVLPPEAKLSLKGPLGKIFGTYIVKS